jgi:D-alanine--poly(phosphoribitol) ligase subunit 2
MKEQVLDILENISGTDEVRDNLDVNLFDSGIMDSMASVMLVVELEGIGVNVPISEFNRDDFDTPNKIINYANEFVNA